MVILTPGVWYYRMVSTGWGNVRVEFLTDAQVQDLIAQGRAVPYTTPTDGNWGSL